MVVSERLERSHSASKADVLPLDDETILFLLYASKKKPAAYGKEKEIHKQQACKLMKGKVKLAYIDYTANTWDSSFSPEPSYPRSKMWR